MSVFEVISENGLYRKLRSKDGFETPILLSTLEKPKFDQIVLTERGLIDLTEINLDDDHKEFPLSYGTKIEEWSIITPRLTINYSKLEVTQKQEEEIFLNRLKTYKLPNAFGLVFDPDSSKLNYLSELLAFHPSFVVLKMEAIESLPSYKVINLITIVRKLIPPNIAIYLAGGVPLGFFGILISLGIDIFDDNSVYRLASFKQSFEDGFVTMKDLSLPELIQINTDELVRDFNAVLKHLDTNTIWTRIARDMHAHPMIASFVTLLSKDKEDMLFIDGYSSYKTNKLNFTGEESFSHPDVIKYHRRLLSNYTMPTDKRVLVLLPCSAKKPYQESKTHRSFVKTIKQSTKKYFNDVEVWSLTSPIGVVPRELERIYPTMFYDLPVTGNWTVEESEQCGYILQELVKEIEIPIIVHVSKGYQKMVEIGLSQKSNVKQWIGDKPASWESLNHLNENLTEVVSNFKPGDKNYQKTTIQNAIMEITALIHYHHGIKCKLDLNDITVQGRPPRPVQIQRNKQHLLSWDVFKGRINLSLDGAIELAKNSEKWVLTDADELKGSSLFAIGVSEASDLIAPDDEILIFNKTKTKLLGIGTAITSGRTMKQINYGRVASLRKKGVFQLDN